MDDFVYDLKISKKMDIKTLEKNTRFTRVHVKAMDTLPVGYPTKLKLDSVIGDVMAGLKQKNLRMENRISGGSISDNQFIIDTVRNVVEPGQCSSAGRTTRIDHRLPDAFRYLERKGTQRRTSVLPCLKK